MKRSYGDWNATDLKDMRGQIFQIGDKVVRGTTSGCASNLEISEVTRIENGKLYLSESRVSINFPSRLLIVTKLF